MMRLLVLAFALITLGGSLAQASSQEDAYWNYSSAPSFIKVWLRDPQSGESRRMIFENPNFVDLLHAQWGTTAGQERPFSIENYVAFMMSHEGRQIDIDFSALERALSERFGSDEAATAYIEDQSFERPLTLAELGFASEKQLISAYFESVGGSYWLRDKRYWMGSANAWEPTFIALLIDLGFHVSRGDILPVLMISRSAD